MKILFLLPYPLHVAPSQRFRVEQYFKILTSANHQYKVQSFFMKPAKNDSMAQKVWAVGTGYCRRILMLFTVFRFDFIFIHREAAPLGPPLIEWVLSRVFRKKVIYDFDDAIWATDNQHESKLEKFLRWRSKVKAICSWSRKVSCGNGYLAAYAGAVNPNAIVNPTTIDTVYVHNKTLFASVKKTGVVIGWTGSHSTVKYLEALEPVFQHLEKKYNGLKFLVMSDTAPRMKIASLVFVPWSAGTEVEGLLEVDIGIMPLPDDDWAKGKCGFKALQYMALEIPAVVSPVGVNSEIVLDGVNGFLCSTTDEWISKIEALLESETLRAKLGKAGRTTVEDHYSVTSNAANFLSLFE